MTIKTFKRPVSEDVFSYAIADATISLKESIKISKLLNEFEAMFKKDLLARQVLSTELIFVATYIEDSDYFNNLAQEDYVILKDAVLLFLDFYQLPLSFFNLISYQHQRTLDQFDAVISQFELKSLIDSSNTLQDFVYKASFLKNTKMSLSTSDGDVQARDKLLQDFFDKFKDSAKSQNHIGLMLGKFDAGAGEKYGVYFGGIKGVPFVPVLWKENDSYQLMPVNINTNKPASKVPLKMSEQELARLTSKYDTFTKLMTSVYIPQHQLIERFIRRMLRV